MSSILKLFHKKQKDELENRDSRHRTSGRSERRRSQPSNAFTMAQAMFDADTNGGVYIGDKGSAQNSSFASSQGDVQNNNVANNNTTTTTTATTQQQQQQSSDMWMKDAAPYYFPAPAKTKFGPRSLDLNVARHRSQQQQQQYAKSAVGAPTGRRGSQRTSTDRRHRHVRQLEDEEAWSDVASDLGYRNARGSRQKQTTDDKSRRRRHKDRINYEFDEYDSGTVEIRDTQSEIMIQAPYKPRQQPHFYPKPSTSRVISEESPPSGYGMKPSHSDYGQKLVQQQHSVLSSPGRAHKDRMLMPPPPSLLPRHFKTSERWVDLGPNSSRRGDHSSTEIQHLDSSPTKRTPPVSGTDRSGSSVSPPLDHRDKVMIKRLRAELQEAKDQRQDAERREQRLVTAVRDTLTQMHSFTGSQPRSLERHASVDNLTVWLREELGEIGRQIDELQRERAEKQKMEHDYNEVFGKAADYVAKLTEQNKALDSEKSQLHQRVLALEFENKCLHAQLQRQQHSKKQQGAAPFKVPHDMPRMAVTRSQQAVTHRTQHEHDFGSESIMSITSQKFMSSRDDSPIENGGEAMCTRPNSFMVPPSASTLSQYLDGDATPTRRSKGAHSEVSSTPVSRYRRDQFIARNCAHEYEDMYCEDEVYNFAQNRCEVDSGTGTSTAVSQESADSCSPRSISTQRKLKTLPAAPATSNNNNNNAAAGAYKENCAPQEIHNLSSISEAFSIEKARGGHGGASGSSIASSTAFVASLISEGRCKTDASSTPKSTTPPTKRTHSAILEECNETEESGEQTKKTNSSKEPQQQPQQQQVIVACVTKLVQHQAAAVLSDTTNHFGATSTTVIHSTRSTQCSPAVSVDDDGYATLTSDTYGTTTQQQQQQQQPQQQQQQQQQHHKLAHQYVSCDDLLVQHWRTGNTSTLSAPMVNCAVDGRLINAELKSPNRLRRSMSDSMLSGNLYSNTTCRLSRLLRTLVYARARNQWPINNTNRSDQISIAALANRSMSSHSLTGHGRDMMQFDEKQQCTSTDDGGTATTSSSIDVGVVREAMYDHTMKHQQSSSMSPDSIDESPITDRENRIDEPELLRASSDNDTSSSTASSSCASARIGTPKMRTNRRMQSFTSEDSEDDGLSTVQAWVRQLKTKRAPQDRRRAVVRYSPPRKSILQGDLYRHFGSRERKALAMFDFLANATDISSSNECASPSSCVDVDRRCNTKRTQQQQEKSRPAELQTQKQTSAHDSDDNDGAQLYENLPYQQRQKSNLFTKPRKRVSRHSSLDSIKSNDSSLLLSDLCAGNGNADGLEQSFSSGSSLSFQSSS